MMNKTFYLIDDHEMLRLGTVSYIEHNSDWVCIGSSANQETALADFAAFQSRQQLPAIVISDLNFYGEDSGFSFVQRLHSLYPEQKIVVYSMLFAPGYVQNAIDSGAIGYISKNASSDELLLCMDKALQGETYIQSQLEPQLQQYNSFSDALTHREKDVLGFILRHYSNDQIAHTLNIKKRAVENYISNIYEKTGIASKTALINLFDAGFTNTF